jgi:subtilisin family serine protease
VSHYSIDSTHVAGIACGAKHGVASNCILCDVRVLSGNWNRKSNIHHILQGLNHVLVQCKGGRDLCVINTSIGGVNRINWDVRSKVEELVFAGISVVVAGGNKKPNRDPPVVDACIKTYSSSPFAIVVGSMGRNNEVYGNYGPCITVYAPGIGIWSAGTDSPTDIVQKSGSSMATPCKFHYCCSSSNHY